MTRIFLTVLTLLGLMMSFSVPVQAEGTLYEDVHLSFDDWDKTNSTLDRYDMSGTMQTGIVTTSVPSTFVGNFATGNDAIINCDKAALDSVIKGLEEQKDHLDGMGRSQPNELFGSREIAQARSDGNALARGINNLKFRWNAAQPCGGEKANNDQAVNSNAGFSNSDDDGYDTALRYAGEFGAIRIASGIKAGAIKLNGVPGFGGTEAGGLNRQLGVIKPDDTGNIFGLSSQLRIPLGNVPNWMPNWPNLPNMPNVLFPNISNEEFWDIFFGFEHLEANISGVAQDFDVGANDFLIIGVGTGPNAAGFVVPAPNGDVTNIAYDADHDFGSYDFGFGKNIRLPNVNNIGIRPFGGLRYGHSKSHETFSAITNAATLPFSYDTKVKNKFLAPFVGVEATARPPWLLNTLGAPIELTSMFSYSFVFNDAEADDTLAVQGFVPATAMIESNDRTHDFKAGVGFTINPDGPFSVTVGGNFQSMGNIPEITRDGADLSQLRFDNANVWTGDIRFIYKF